MSVSSRREATSSESSRKRSRDASSDDSTKDRSSKRTRTRSEIPYHTLKAGTFQYRTTQTEGLPPKWRPLEKTQEEWSTDVGMNLADIAAKAAILSMQSVQATSEDYPDEAPGIIEDWSEDDWKVWTDKVIPSIATNMKLHSQAPLPAAMSALHPLVLPEHWKKFNSLDSKAKRQTYVDSLYDTAIMNGKDMKGKLVLDCTPFLTARDTVYLKWNLSIDNGKIHQGTTCEVSLKDGSLFDPSDAKAHRKVKLSLPDVDLQDEEHKEAYEKRNKKIDKHGTGTNGTAASRITEAQLQARLQEVFQTLAVEGEESVSDDPTDQQMVSMILGSSDMRSQLKKYREHLSKYSKKSGTSHDSERESETEKNTTRGSRKRAKKRAKDPTLSKYMGDASNKDWKRAKNVLDKVKKGASGLSKREQQRLLDGDD